MCKNCILLKVSITYTNTEELTSLFAVLSVFSYLILKWLVKLLYAAMIGLRLSLLVNHTELLLNLYRKAGGLSNLLPCISSQSGIRYFGNRDRQHVLAYLHHLIPPSHPFWLVSKSFISSEFKRSGT